MVPTRMTLKVLLPFGVYTEQAGVSRIVVETRQGSLGLLPQRLDCVAAVAPGLLLYETDEAGEVLVAVDEGVLVKAGPNVFVSVRQAIGGADLGSLRDAVEKEFLIQDEYEKSVQAVMTKLETGVIRRLAKLKND